MMSNGMSKEEFESFLTCGAILRQNDSYHLVQGPFASPANKEEIQILFPDFFMDSETEFVSGSNSFQISQELFSEYLDGYLSDRPNISKLDWIEPELDKYREAFDQTKSEMISGELKKAVPVLFARAQTNMDKVKRAQILRNLNKSPLNLYVYGKWNEDEGVLGASPETLVNFESGNLKSMALAGTQSRSTELCNLLGDPKEVLEHQLVVDDIIESLAPWGVPISVGPEVLELKQLWHLKTDISLRLESPFDPKEIIEKLHPTPALGVSPRSFDYNWLRRLPDADIRKRFGAPFAMLFPNGDFVSVVAIRNIQWEQGQVLLGAGGGVVSMSHFENEWLELEHKRNSVRTMMGI